jgi:hypothetical protein
MILRCDSATGRAVSRSILSLSDGARTGTGILIIFEKALLKNINQ